MFFWVVVRNGGKEGMTFWGGGRLVKHSYACGMGSASSLFHVNLMIIVQKMIPIGVFFFVHVSLFSSRVKREKRLITIVLGTISFHWIKKISICQFYILIWDLS